MLVFVDQMGRPVLLEHTPQRIISLVPSQTEFLYDVGLQDEVVGITKFCVHPEQWYRSKPRVGGTKQYHFDRIAALQPDFIIGNKEENEKEQIERLMEQYPVWMSDIYGLEDAYEMMLNLGEILGKSEQSKILVNRTRLGFTNFRGGKGLKVVYLIWHNPIMAAANHTFIQEMLTQCGWVNALAEQRRYPQLTIEALQSLDPDLLLLSSEPFPFKEKHINFYQEHLPNTQVKLVDGEAFSWYGSRLLNTQPYLQDLVNELSEAL